MVLVGVVLKRFATTFLWVYKVYSSCGFQQGNNIGITSSTCRHCTLMHTTSLFCLFLFIPSLYPLVFYSLFSSLLPFLLHACMYSHQVYNSNGGLAPKIAGLSIWTKSDGYSYEQALSCYVQVYFPTVIC